MVGSLLLLVIGGLLVVAASFVPKTASFSRFERKRLSKTGHAAAVFDAQRERLAGDVISLQRSIIALLMILFVVQAITVLGWLVGSLLATAVALTYNALARIPFIRSFAQKYYDKYEQQILGFVEKHQKVLWWLRSIAPEITDPTINSKAEFEHLVELSGNTLSADEKKLIQHSLTFDERLVKDVMTPRSMIASIKKTEILGPLVLDDLHKTGHSRFPVTDGDLDHIIGTLYLRDVLILDTSRKHTSLVETAMEKRVLYIHEDQSLTHALTAFLKTHHHLFVVVNEFRETVGLLSLEDTMEALLGRSIVDEFDAHDDLRSVAARNPKSNKRSATATDV